MEMPPTAPKYRPDIDGLRAVAVLGVLLYHIEPSWLSGGFVGVDVFFVISGFLITAIITREIDRGDFSMMRFYERRIRRIIPALYAMFLVVTLASWKFLLPEDFMDLGKSMRYALFSVSNFHFLEAAGDYFHAGVELMPLLHTWSLAVEEQFYLFFPAILVFFHRWFKTKEAAIAMVTVLALVSLFTSQQLVQRSPEPAFYLLPWRAWELLLGSLIALCRPSIECRKLRNAIGLSGLVMILASMMLFTSSMPFPGFAALLPCLGAVFVIVSGAQGSAMAARILGSRPLVFIGLISYSVYLWHWPFIVFAKYTLVYEGWVKHLILGLSLVAGWISWKFIEEPFRSSRIITHKKVYLSWAVSSIVILFGCLVMKRADGFETRFPQNVLNYLAAEDVPERYSTRATENHDPYQAPVFGDASQEPTMALWGDSHANAILPVMDELGRKHGKAIVSFDMSSQPPIVGITRGRFTDSEKRASYTVGVLARLVESTKIHTVFIHARWASYARNDDQDADEPPPALYGHSFDTIEAQQRFISKHFDRTMHLLLEAGKRVVIIYPVPEIKDNAPARIAALGRTPPSEAEAREYNSYNSNAIAILDRWAGAEGVEMVRPASKLLRSGKVKIRDGDNILYRDDDHLSLDGALYLTDLFEDLFVGDLAVEGTLDQ